MSLKRTLPEAVILKRLAADLLVLALAPGLPHTTENAARACTGLDYTGIATADTALRKPRPETLAAGALTAEADMTKEAMVPRV